MVIYGAILISIIVTVLLYAYCRKKVAWWEYFVPITVSLLLVIGAKAIIEHAQVTSKEYWGSVVQRVEYYEDWDEWITQICSKECCCDANGNNCSQEPYDCSHRDYHPAYWQIITTTGEKISISQSEYVRIKGILGNETFKDLHRDYYTDDGDEYFATWDGSEQKAVPVTTVHRYENRVKASDLNVFHFQKVDDLTIKKYGLVDYPEMVGGYTLPAIIGDSSKDAILANRKLDYVNGILGPKKEVRIFVIVFKNQPLDAGMYQEWYWAGANMNEFVVCIGTDNARNVTWCKPISWTYNESLKIGVRNFVSKQKKLDLVSLANYLEKEVGQKFQRRDFKEFDYLTVEPPTWAVVLTYVITLLVNLAIGYWVITNDFDEEEEVRRGYYVRTGW